MWDDGGKEEKAKHCVLSLSKRNVKLGFKRDVDSWRLVKLGVSRRRSGFQICPVCDMFIYLSVWLFLVRQVLTQPIDDLALDGE